MWNAAVEATDPDAPSRRAAAARRASRDVQKDQAALDRQVIKKLLARLRQLKGELQGVIASNAGTYRTFTTSSLIASIDGLIADAQRDLLQGTRTVLSKGFELGVADVDEPLKAARIAVGSAPRLDPALVTNAFELTADLLSEPMQKFRNEIVRRVRRAAIAGDSSVDQMRDLAANVGSAGYDNALFAAERIIRTELGRVMTGATYDRLVALEKELPFIRKGWRHTKDNRTRLGHVEAGNTYVRGTGTIPIRDRFRVNVYQERPNTKPRLLGVALLRFPIDPETTPTGRIAAGATIMCRCGIFIDFRLDELQAFATSRSQAVGIQPTAPPRGFAEPPVGPRATTPPARSLPVPIATPGPVTDPMGGQFLTEYSGRLRDALADAYGEMLAASRFDRDRDDWREVLRVFGPEGQRYRLHIGDRDSVTITRRMDEEIAASGAGYVFIHTHPSGSAFSFPDLNVFARFNRVAGGGGRMVVFGNYGSWFELVDPEGRLTRASVAAMEGDYVRLRAASFDVALRRTRQWVDAQIAALPADERPRALSQWASAHSADARRTFDLIWQEESAEFMTQLAARYGLRYRYHLPVLQEPIVGNKNRSREALISRGADSDQPIDEARHPPLMGEEDIHEIDDRDTFFEPSPEELDADDDGAAGGRQS